MKNASTPQNQSHVSALLVALSATLLIGSVGCEKDEPPPPLPTAEPTASVAEPTVQLMPEPDAGTDAGEDAGKKTTGTYRPATSLTKCCSALRSNAQHAPEPNKTYMLQAAAVCDAAVGAGQSPGPALGVIRAALKGAQLPGGCK